MTPKLQGAQRAVDDLVGSDVIRGAVVGYAGSNGWGYATAGTITTESQRRQVRVDDLFLLTSVAKVITATQILILAVQGRLELDDFVSEYIPDRSGPVTIRHLLSHTSGISQDADVAEGEPTALTSQAMVNVAAHASLDWEPGTRARYCSAGFWLLAEVITQVSGMPYHDHLRTAITEPLGMTATRYGPWAVPPGLARHASPRNDHLAEQVRRLRYPAGGIVGSAPDLLRFGRAILGDDATSQGWPTPWKEVSRSLWNLDPKSMVRDDDGQAYHLGWRVFDPLDRSSHGSSLWHPGASGTVIWLDKGRDAAVTMLSADWYLTDSVLMGAAQAALNVIEEVVGDDT